MTFKKFFEKVEVEMFHGTPHTIEKFTDDFVGNGTDQEGPGIYFTNNEEDAYGYARKSENGGQGRVYKVRLEMNKVIPNKGRVKEDEINSLITWCENYEEKMMDWGHEDLPSNIKEFKQSLKREKTPKDIFLSVWYNLYRYQSQEYVKNMVILGYDGFFVKRDFLNTTHGIVYNPKCIKVLDVY